MNLEIFRTGDRATRTLDTVVVIHSSNEDDDNLRCGNQSCHPASDSQSASVDVHPEQGCWRFLLQLLSTPFATNTSKPIATSSFSKYL
uniref:Uncharacterized protein n=1 Tax=Syphacia muris TaxID=451379 RepID=A0A0N5AHL0_9BILA